MTSFELLEIALLEASIHSKFLVIRIKIFLLLWKPPSWVFSHSKEEFYLIERTFPYDLHRILKAKKRFRLD